MVNKEHVITAVCVIAMVASGTAVQLSMKGQTYQKAPISPSDPTPQEFNHPYMQTVMMFVGEACCLFTWLIQHFVTKKQGKIPPLQPGKKWYKFIPHTFLFIVPTACDLIGSTLINAGIFFTLVSISQMLRNLNVLFVATFSSIFFRDYRQKFDLPQGIGLLILVCGNMLISYSAVGFSGADETAKDNVLGVILTLLGTVFAALFYVTEEIFLRGVQLEASLAVTNEGFWGLILHAILMPIYESVDDPFSSANPKPKMENCYAWYYQSKSSPLIAGLIASQVIFTLGFNQAGCEITNRVASATRTTFETIRVILIWIISIGIGWETWHSIATPIRIVGFVLVTTGVFLYNNVTQWLPFLKPINKEKYGKCGSQCKKSKSNDVTSTTLEDPKTEVLTATQ